MSRVLRVLTCVLLLLALPLQGLAAQATLLCAGHGVAGAAFDGAVFEGAVFDAAVFDAAVSDRLGADGHLSHTAQTPQPDPDRVPCHGPHALPTDAVAAPFAGIDAPTEAGACSGCSVCAACCFALALPAALSNTAMPSVQADYPGAAMAAATGLGADTLERPPRH